MFGLIESDLNYIKSALAKFDEIESAIIFGSRAMGNYKKGSDIDLAIKGRDISTNTVFLLSELLNDQYPLPYFFDIVDYESILNENLKEHIDKEGIEINVAGSVKYG